MAVANSKSEQVQYLKNNLDILIITWNRQAYLSRMLASIFDKDSPICECSITVIDNHSTDGTADYLKSMQEKHPNLKHIRNKYNIGGDPNLLKALETVDTTKKYFWVLADDDILDWTHWQNVQTALESDEYDVLVVGKLNRIDDEPSLDENKNKAMLFKHLSWIPAGIYKSKNLNSNLIENAYGMTLFLFPILSICAQVLNNNGKIFSIDYKETIVVWADPYYFDVANDQSYSRGTRKSHLLPKRSSMVYETAMASVIGIIENHEIRKYLMDLVGNHNGQTFGGVLKWYIPHMLHLGAYDELLTFYKACNEQQKKDFSAMFAKYMNEREFLRLQHDKKCKSMLNFPLKVFFCNLLWRVVARAFKM